MLNFNIDIDTKRYMFQKDTFNTSIEKHSSKIIISIIKDFSANKDHLYLNFESIQGEYVYNKTNNDNYLTLLYLITKSYIEKEDIKVLIDITNNEIIDIYPIESRDLSNERFKDKLIHKKLKKISIRSLPKYELLKNIEQVDLEWNSIGLIKYDNSSKWYFCDTNYWHMNFWESDFERKDNNSSSEFPEKRIKNYFKEYEVNSKDVQQTIRYLLDIEKPERVKALLPSFYLDYQRKEYISFRELDDDYDIENLLTDWSGRYEKTYKIIPEENRYWIINGKDLSK